ncbi:MAG: type IX secretion system membrane protein PorP/SprF [Elusimicrobiota bacterium]
MNITYISKLIKRHYINYVIAVLLLSSVFILPSAVNGAFKDIGWGARPAGMGNTFVAISNDANSSVFNPAGMTQLQKREASFAYAKPYVGLENVDLGLMYLTYVHPAGEAGAFSVAVTNFDGAGLYRENVYQLGYARRVYADAGVKFSAGLNLKYLSHSYIWDQRTKDVAAQIGDRVVAAGDSKGAVSADIGLMASLPKHWTFGAAAKNINQPDVGLAYEDKVPSELTVGAAYKIPYYKGMDAITAALDVSQRNQDWGRENDKTNLHFGAETWFGVHTYGVRAGWNKNEISMGASMNRRLAANLSFQIDYAFIWSLSISDNIGSHRLGMSTRF